MVTMVSHKLNLTAFMKLSELVTECAQKSDAKQKVSIIIIYNEQNNTINTTPDATDEEKEKH